MIEAHYQHYVTFFVGPDYHVAQKASMVSYVEKSETVLHSIFLYEKPDGIRRVFLKSAFLYVQYLVEKSSDVESESASVAFGNGIGILPGLNPSSVRKGEFQFVPVIYGPVGGDYR